MKNLIEWPRAQYWDKCWNPWIGCDPCSPACDNCYAAAIAKRFKMQFYPPHETDQTPQRSGVVFCGNMTDLFGHWMDWVDSSRLIAQTLGYSRKATYLWLTKRPSKMGEALNKGTLLYRDEDGDHESPFFDCEFGNQYFGMTAEDQEYYSARIDSLCGSVPVWAKCWLSAEPLLGPIDLSLGYIHKKCGLPFKPFEWVVVGCESGPNRRPCKIEWVKDIVYQCKVLGIKVFVKQLDIDGKCVTDINKFPEDLRIRQVPWEV